MTLNTDILQELKSFREYLFRIDFDEDSSKDELREILDKYQSNNFEAFAEEYLIAGLDVSFVSQFIQPKCNTFELQQ